MSRLKLLLNELNKKLKIFRRELESLCKIVNSERSNTFESVRSHEILLHSKKYGAMKIDPWLTERELHKKINKMIIEENNFQAGMGSLLLELSKFDRFLKIFNIFSYIIEEMKRILEELSLARSSLCAAIQKHTKTASFNATQTHSSVQFEEFSAKYSFDDERIWKTTRKVNGRKKIKNKAEDFPYKLTEIKILKKGLLYLPSTLLKNRWFPTLAVLTESGFLHCFSLSSIRHQAILKTYDTEQKEATGLQKLIRRMTRKNNQIRDEDVYNTADFNNSFFRYFRSY